MLCQSGCTCHVCHVLVGVPYPHTLCVCVTFLYEICSNRYTETVFDNVENVKRSDLFATLCVCVLLVRLVVVVGGGCIVFP